MSAQHPSDLFHRLQATAHGPEAPIVEKSSRPDHGFVLPEMGQGLLQFPGARRGQLAGQQGIEFLSRPPANPAAAAQQGPARVLEPLGRSLVFRPQASGFGART